MSFRTESFTETIIHTRMSARCDTCNLLSCYADLKEGGDVNKEWRLRNPLWLRVEMAESTYVFCGPSCLRTWCDAHRTRSSDRFDPYDGLRYETPPCSGSRASAINRPYEPRSIQLGPLSYDRQCTTCGRWYPVMVSGHKCVTPSRDMVAHLKKAADTPSVEHGGSAPCSCTPCTNKRSW